jgi:hypothetical protein
VTISNEGEIEGEIEGFALQLRTKSKHKATKGYVNACLWIVCTVVSTFGA